MKKIILTNVILVLLFLPLMAQESESLNEAFKTHLQKDYFKLNLLIQSEGRFPFHDDDFQGGRTFSVPNARVSLRGKLDGGFFYRLFVDAAPKPTLLDAYVGYNLDEACKISVGAMKPRPTLDYIPDPGSHNFVDRATITGLLVGSREIGISATGDIGGFYYYTGLFNGSRMEDNTNNKFYGIGRLQYRLENLFPGYIQLGVSGSYGNSEGTVAGSRGPLLRGQRSITGADMEMQFDQIYFAAEYLRGELETVDLPNINEVISGYYLTGGYKLKERIMLFSRWQSWSYEAAGTTKTKLTFGSNFDFTNVVGLVINIDAYMPDEGDTQFGAAFIFQVQI